MSSAANQSHQPPLLWGDLTIPATISRSSVGPEEEVTLTVSSYLFKPGITPQCSIAGRCQERVYCAVVYSLDGFVAHMVVPSCANHYTLMFQPRETPALDVLRRAIIENIVRLERYFQQQQMPYGATPRVRMIDKGRKGI